MPISRKAARGSRAFALPLIGIAFLLACYWILAEWQQVPTILSNALATVRWPS